MDTTRINVREFGARGDLVSDDTVALQAAIDAALARGRAPGGKRAVWLPGGDYLTGPLRLGPDLTLLGDGSGVSRLFSRDSGQAVMRLGGIARNTSSLHLHNLGFFAHGRGGIGLDLAGRDEAARVIGVRVEGCQFSLFDIAVRLRLCNSVWLAQAHASACTTGFAIDTSSDVKLHQCFADSGGAWAYDVFDDGRHGASGEGVYLIGCVSNAQAGGLRVRGQNWGEAIGCSFTSCRGDAVRLDGASGWRVAQGEIATASEGRGVVLGGEARKCLIEGNYIALCNGAILAGGSDHLISGNLLDAGIGASPDIELAGTGCKVGGNKCMSVASPDSIVETGRANFNYITGNMVQGAITARGAGTKVSDDQFRY
jgi:hypothetical protein